MQEFETEIKNKCPFKIDVGAVFNMRFVKLHFKIQKLCFKIAFIIFSPKVCRNYPQFHAMEKELVIDIDMTDYDQIRTCCSGADVCEKCWRYV